MLLNPRAGRAIDAFLYCGIGARRLEPEFDDWAPL